MKRWTLREPYRNLLDAKVSTLYAQEAVEKVLEAWDWEDGWAILRQPDIFQQESDAALYEFDKSLWSNGYDLDGIRCMPREELRLLVVGLITQE